MFCEECGSKLPEGAKFCENCGTPVRTAAQAEVRLETEAGGLAQTQAVKAPASQAAGSGPKLYYPDPERYRRYMGIKERAAIDAADKTDDFQD